MNLTPEQQQAIKAGEAVESVVDGVPIVMLRKDVYQQVQRVLEADLSPRDFYDASLRALGDDGMEAAYEDLGRRE